MRDLQAAGLELRLERLLGELLLVEIDRQLDVIAVDRRDTVDLTDDPARVVDLVRDEAPLAVQFVLHAQLDAELADPFVQVVTGRGVRVLRVGGDAAHVADHVAGERRVRIHAARLLLDRHAGQVLDAFLDRGGRAFVDVLGHGHRQERAVHLALEARFHVLDGHVDPARQAPEDLGAVLVAAQHRPVDRHGEHALVVGHDATVGIEDPATFGQQRDRAQLGGVHLLLERLLLDGLQEPEAGTDEAEQQGADEREHA